MLFLTVLFVDIKLHARGGWLRPLIIPIKLEGDPADAHADVIGDQPDAVTQNAWFRCTLCAAISGEISILIQTGAESWGRFPIPRICSWESNPRTMYM